MISTALIRCVMPQTSARWHCDFKELSFSSGVVSGSKPRKRCLLTFEICVKFAQEKLFVCFKH